MAQGRSNKDVKDERRTPPITLSDAELRVIYSTRIGEDYHLLLSLQHVEPKLEEVFMRLTKASQ